MTDTTETAVTNEKPAAGAVLAAVVLLLLALLAFDPLKLVQVSAAEKITLLFLACCTMLAAYSPLRRHFQNPDAAAAAFTVVWFVIYALARRAGPTEGWNHSLETAPEYLFKFSYATRLAIAGAVTAAALNRTVLSGFTRAALVAMLIATALLLGNFAFLSNFFKVGETNTLDPIPITHALLQFMEYGAVAVLCGVAAADTRIRQGLLKLLPILLLALWARHQFGPVPVDEDE